jgi:23S rRNA (uracil1939-C5)-methyltransferase
MPYVSNDPSNPNRVDHSCMTKRKARPPLELELSLGGWSPKGTTVAEHEGRRISIDRGIPGERVLAEVDRRSRQWRGVVRETIVSAACRVTPPCPYYEIGCGGCQWQHLDYDSQLQAKRSVVDAQLEGVGLEHRVDQVHCMDDPWRYRRTASIAIGWEAGFRPRARHGIVEIHDCLISHPLIGELADRLNLLLRAGKLPNYHGRVWLDSTVVGCPDNPAIQVLLQGIEGLTLETHPELPQLAEELSRIESVHSVAFRHRSGEPRPLVGDLMSQIEVAGKPLWLPAGSFFQTNLQMLELVLSRMRAIVSARHTSKAADLYGGVGTFALHLASHVDEMHLVELDSLAADAAARTAAEWGLTNLTALASHAERALPLLDQLDLIVVDPPRSGLGLPVTEAIVRNGAALILYLSCAPGSLARDLASLVAGGYALESVDIFDFYPQTYHVESLAVLTR